jgi:hypothetical protein
VSRLGVPRSAAEQTRAEREHDGSSAHRGHRDRDDFIITTELDAYEGDIRVHGTERSVQIPGHGV